MGEVPSPHCIWHGRCLSREPEAARKKRKGNGSRSEPKRCEVCDGSSDPDRSGGGARFPVGRQGGLVTEPEPEAEIPKANSIESRREGGESNGSSDPHRSGGGVRFPVGRQGGLVTSRKFDRCGPGAANPSGRTAEREATQETRWPLGFCYSGESIPRRLGVC